MLQYCDLRLTFGKLLKFTSKVANLQFLNLTCFDNIIIILLQKCVSFYFWNLADVSLYAGVGSTTTDREPTDCEQTDRKQHRLAENCDPKYIFTIPRAILPKPSFCDKMTETKSCNKIVASRSVCSRSVCDGQLTWLGRGQAGFCSLVAIFHNLVHPTFPNLWQSCHIATFLSISFSVFLFLSHQLLALCLNGTSFFIYSLHMPQLSQPLLSQKLFQSLYTLHFMNLLIVYFIFHCLF